MTRPVEREYVEFIDELRAYLGKKPLPVEAHTRVISLDGKRHMPVREWMKLTGLTRQGVDQRYRALVKKGLARRGEMFAEVREG